MHPLVKELGIDPSKYEEQCKQEIAGYSFAMDRYLTNVSRTQADENKDVTALLEPEKNLLKTYIHALATGLTKTIALPERREKGYPRLARLFLEEAAKDVSYERMAYVTLRYALNLDGDGVSTSNMVQPACIKLGHQFEKDYEYSKFQTTCPAYLSAVEENLKSSHARHRNAVLTHAQNSVKIFDEDGNLIGTGIPPLNWDDPMRFAVGKILLEALTTYTPLFAIMTKTSRKRVSSAKLGFVNVGNLILVRTQLCNEWIEKYHKELSVMQPLANPLLIHPKPWSGVEGGGFWTDYMKLRSKLLKTDAMRTVYRVKRHGVKIVNDALNVIQATKWRINKRVLEVMKEGSKTGLGKLPVFEPSDVALGSGRHPLDEPCPWEPHEFERLKKKGDPEIRAWSRDRSIAWDQWYRNRSKREALLWKLNIAEKFKDEPEFYFVWNLDYRGRIYCQQPFLNPQVDDSGKGLLEFADGMALGETGIEALMQHGANVFGYDKATLPERVQWVRDNHEKIIESAENPLDGYRFWCDADKPYCFLAFCFEYTEAIKDTTGYVSHLPVQVDGTCSGLQHYSALLRDEVGGKVVNLVPADAKADVYAEAAIVTNKLLQEDLAKGGDEAKYAKMWLDIGVDRSILKRNVMTFCYGSTRAGFKQQLIDLVTKDHIKFPEGEEINACNYLGNLNWQAVETTLVKSVEGMQLLQKIASYVAKLQQDIQWSNGVGLRVTQDYLKTETIRIDTRWGNIRIKPSIARFTDKKDVVGSRNGIAPNYIHSLDASHLMLTALKCAERGISAFSFIHDSFGCHAGAMSIMNEVLRETFIEMYSENLLDKFIDDVRGQLYPEHLADFDAIVAEFKPKMGSLDLQSIQRSPYFFS